MKKIFLLTFLSIVMIQSLHAQELAWAKSIGNNGGDVSNSIVIDNSGNVYIAGSFSGTVDFDPGIGFAYLTSAGGTDGFFAKYDSNGNYLWAKRLGYSNINGDVCNSIALDEWGNIYILGSFWQWIDVDPSAADVFLGSGGSSDVFFAKYDNNGNYIWGKSISCTGVDAAHTINTDALGNVYITGQFSGTGNFNPSGVANLTSTTSQIDGFFAKYDTDGNYLWANKIGGTTFDAIKSIAIGSSGNVYICGFFEGTVDFDPSGSVANLISVGDTRDFFFAKYNENGEYIWAHGFGGWSSDECNSIVVDDMENVYITGNFWSTIDFDPHAGTAELTSAGGLANAFIAKYNSNGEYIWANAILSAGTSVGTSITTDESENVYITGYFNTTADFDPGVDEILLTANGGDDIFFTKYDINGDYILASNIGSTTGDIGMSIKANNVGEIFITGYFTNTADFDPSSDISNLTSSGNTDIFIAKYGTAGPLSTQLLDFTAVLIQNKVQLTWKLSDEKNTSHYIIERSQNGKEFSTIAEVKANKNIIDTYQTLDKNPLIGNNFYRLAIIDIHGNKNYSNTIFIELENSHSFTVFPNPSKQNIQLNTYTQNEFEINILDITGKIQLHIPSYRSNDNISIEHLPNGIYTIHFSHDNVTHSIKFIKE